MRLSEASQWQGAWGIGGASQRACWGETGQCTGEPNAGGASQGRYAPWRTEGNKRYIQLRKLLSRGAVNDEPESCSG